MQKIDALEVLPQLFPLHPRSMQEKDLRTRVNVARSEPHSKQEWATLLKQMEEQGLLRTKLDKFGDRAVVITDAGSNILAEAGL